MPNKFNMSVENNVFYAKRNVVDSIWKEANIEGIAVTYPETKEIFEGRVVEGLSIDEAVAINNLKRAWQFIFDNLDAPVDLAFVRQVNGVVGSGTAVRPGDLRQYDVMIRGTSWRPEIPVSDSAEEMILKASSIESSQDAALRLLCDLCRAQLFSDGNLRTAQICANKILIAGGAGVLAIPVQMKPEFESLLVDFYETADSGDLERFLVDCAINGYEDPSIASRGNSTLAQARRAERRHFDDCCR